MPNDYDVVGYVGRDMTLCLTCARWEEEPIFGSEEVDAPLSCENCGDTLPTRLTDEGRDYVRKQVLRYQNEGRSGHPDHAGEEVDLERWAEYWPDIQVWVAMSGLCGYLPLFWLAVESEESAVESLDQNHSLTNNQKEDLRNGGQCDLDLEDQGAEYAEVKRMGISELEY